MPKIYTKTGDKGATSILGGKRVPKSCLEMEAIGEVDELNSWLGVLIEEIEEKFKKEAKRLKEIQKRLFVIGAELAAMQMNVRNTKTTKLRKSDTTGLEKWIDEMERKLPKLKNFIPYSGSEEAVKSFYARAICRRAERTVIRLSENYDVSSNVKKYMNRLSDALFILGRWINESTKIL